MPGRTDLSAVAGAQCQADPWGTAKERAAQNRTLESPDHQEPRPRIFRHKVQKMTLRSVPDTIKSLRLILRLLEQGRGNAHDSMNFAQLKCILLRRIAELEVELARHKTDYIGYRIAS